MSNGLSGRGSYRELYQKKLKSNCKDSTTSLISETERKEETPENEIVLTLPKSIQCEACKKCKKNEKPKKVYNESYYWAINPPSIKPTYVAPNPEPPCERYDDRSITINTLYDDPFLLTTKFSTMSKYRKEKSKCKSTDTVAIDTKYYSNEFKKSNPSKEMQKWHSNSNSESRRIFSYMGSSVSGAYYSRT